MLYSKSKMDKALSLKKKWSNYLHLRSHPENCKPGHKDFLTMHQRECMLDQLFNLILSK